MNTIYLRKRSKVLIPHETGTTPKNVLATIQKNTENLGFLLSEEVINELANRDQAKVEQFYKNLIKDLRELVGVHRVFKPMYPNFPSQVMKMSEAELYFNAINHYWTLDRIPSTKAERPKLTEEVTYRIIHLGTRDDFESLFTTLLRSKSPFTPQDKLDIKWFISQYRERIAPLLPNEIPTKENVAIVVAEFICGVKKIASIASSWIRTATDVLRVAVALSGGDVSLAEPVRFGKFSRAERKWFLGMLETFENRTEDMLRWKGRWIRLGERLHPTEYQTRYPKTAEAFDILRNDKPFTTFNSRLESEFKNANTETLLSILIARPGDFARRLDHLSRITKTPVKVADTFTSVAERVSTPVLLQVMTHFRNRQIPTSLRVFFPKGEIGNLFGTEKQLPSLTPEITTRIASICEETLLKRFSHLLPLGRCYLDPKLRNYLVPFSQRSASKTLRTLVRGSQLPLPDCTTLRFFIWWKNGRGRVDLDLSAAMFDENYQYVDTLAYYNLKNFGAYHSGDIVDAPVGAAEFIDVDISKCVENRVRFIVMCVNSFTSQPYCDLPECFAGWMARSHANSGEIFEPKTVIDKVDLASDNKFCIPAIFDLTEGRVIWSDIGLATYPNFANNVHNHLKGVSLMLQAMTQLRKTTLHDLFELHIKSRGEIVSNRNEATVVFAIDQGITPFDLDQITADYL